jgi:cell division cycle protein 20 (cofactor of APC complex)
VSNKSRKIATQPERVLDAPGMVDDLYLNLISWSVQNVVAIALSENTYIWKADSGDVVQIGEPPEGSYVSSVDFSNDGAFLGIGIGSGEVELWDVESGQKLRSMGGHQTQIAALGWHGHILSLVCGDGSIWHHDVRVARHKLMELLGHEVCGLKPKVRGASPGGRSEIIRLQSRLANHSSSQFISARSAATHSLLLFFANIGSCVAPMAAVPSGKWWRDE